ncbi:MAG: hypothetical protein PVS3B3_16940 [Ktedonobacteraceae bacterium]
MRNGRSRLGGLIIAFMVVCIIVVSSAMIYSLFDEPSSADKHSSTVTNSSAPIRFIASIDTMKESRDTETRPLSPTEITTIINLSASLHTNYITVDTNWDYPEYMQLWIDSIRSTGRHVWFRAAPNQWENTNGTTGIMTPLQYKEAEEQFISKHPSFFASKDIFDACPEPEQGLYWSAQYSSKWTYNAPNTATKEFNAFLRDTTDVADKAFGQKGISGVITNIRSISAFIATNILEINTVSKFGRVTVDSYPEISTLDPATAALARVHELDDIERKWLLPIVIGETGYSNVVPVNDIQQQRVLKAEFEAISHLHYLIGMNYWVGPGSDFAGGYTYIIKKVHNDWSLRPAAYELSNFYEAKQS